MTARTCLQRSNGAPHAGQTLRLLERVHQLPALNNILPDLIALQSLPSSLVAHVLDPQPGENILDMCSSPGGKAVHIAGLMQNTGPPPSFTLCSRGGLEVTFSLDPFLLNLRLLR
mmetsp:Transcript_25985/g.72779  ORF Transcript_25985/g.72779 Transcript_25985/m.72779 type:complete len:115 (-) Transcript_25985:910-1254(-)